MSREDIRHARVVARIEAATSTKDLPSVSYNDIANVLASKVYNGVKLYERKIVKNLFDDVIWAIKEYGLKSEKVIYYLTQLMINYCDISNLDFDESKNKAIILYNKIINEGKIGHLYEEIKMLEEKKKVLLKQEENKRHDDILKQIEEAKSIEDLPNISYSTIANYLASKKYKDKKHKPSHFKKYVQDTKEEGNFGSRNNRDIFREIMFHGTFDYHEEDADKKIDKLYDELIDEGVIQHLIHEIQVVDYKKELLLNNEYREKHDEVMKQIRNAFEEKELPKVGIGELNKRILKVVNSNNYIKDFKTSDVSEVAKCFLTKDLSNLKEIVTKFAKPKTFRFRFDPDFIINDIYCSLLKDEIIELIAEEVVAVEKRKREIYESDHNDLMDILKEATRMYQLPSISFSTLTSYLCGNSTIYPNESVFKSEHFKKITELLLAGKKWEDKEIIDELKRICVFFYQSKSDEAFKLLFKKLTSLPKTYYLVDEINLIKNLQAEFIKNGQSNVNVYFVENPKAPKEGGKFYNVYINRVEKLDLYQVLPLDLNSIVAPGTDIDAVEWLVGQKDKTFKKVGGIILYRDETIGDITVYRINDGRVSITNEDKDKLDKINDLDKQICSKEARISELDEMIRIKEEEITKLILDKESRERDRLYISKAVEDIVASSKNKLRLLQKEINDSIMCLDEIESGFVKKIEGPKE